jgi:hypothetical protein
MCEAQQAARQKDKHQSNVAPAAAAAADALNGMRCSMTGKERQDKKTRNHAAVAH